MLAFVGFGWSPYWTKGKKNRETKVGIAVFSEKEQIRDPLCVCDLNSFHFLADPHSSETCVEGPECVELCWYFCVDTIFIFYTTVFGRDIYKMKPVLYPKHYEGKSL